MGGEDTGSTEATKNVLIECAYFDPLRTAATGRKTGLVSDARYRFERGVDPDFMLPGLDLATAMMLEDARRQAVQGDGCRQSCPTPSRSISFDSGQVAKLAGLELPEQPRSARPGGARLRDRGQGRELST